jgi:predicted transcriptional regulator
VLRLYHDLCREIDREALVQLARSKHKRWILQTLETAPARKAALASTGQQQGSPSRTTVHRIIHAFVADGYVLERGGEYEVTELGRLLLRSYTEIRTVIAHALDKREFLRWLPADLESFPIDALADSKGIRNTPKEPHNVLDAFSRIAGTDFSKFRGITTIVSPTLASAYYPVLDSEAQVSVIFPDEIMSQLHTDHEFINFVKQHGVESYIRDGQPAQNSEFVFVSEMLPVHLAICDDARVMLSPSPSTGVPESSTSAIDSTNPEVVDWAVTFFKSYRDKGCPPFHTVPERRLAKDSDPQRRAGV